MVGLAFRMLGDMAAAEDMAQEAFLRLWRQARRWKPQAKVSTWLYQVIYNLCIDQLRHRQWEADEEAPDRPDTAAGPMDLRHRGQLAEIVEAALTALPTRQRTAITLVHLQEVSNMEAAHIMGVSVEALESLLARGRRTLRKHLESGNATSRLVLRVLGHQVVGEKDFSRAT
jgi:RNA polymerase sigma-70 factor, ECF subfamily